MRLNIKTKILLNGVLSVVISIMLVTVIIFFLLWEQSEKRARQEIRHAVKVISLHIREMESAMKETAVRISNNQEYANKANFIQENAGNKSLAEMLDGERRELAISLYEVAMTSRIPMLVLYDAAGERMCAVSLESHQARLSYLSDHDQRHLWEAVVPPGVPPRTEQWQKKPGLQQTLSKYRLPLPISPNMSIEEQENHLRVTAVSPLRVHILNPATLKQELVQNGLVQVSRHLDDSFIRSLSDLTDKQINLFLGTNLNVGTLGSYTSLERKFLSKRKTSQASNSPDLPQISDISELSDMSQMIDMKRIIYKERRVTQGVFFEGLVSVLIKNRVIGAFSVLLSQEETRKAQQQMIRMLFFAAMISILIVTPLTWFLAIKEIIEREQMQKELARHRDHLEELVKERTAELASANEQLDQKNSDLNETLEKVEEANMEITESIRYARTIQRSLLTPSESVKSYLPDSFFIWMPCEIVSGDIYHIDSFEDGVLVSVIDCTGHGVPGAFMTMLVFSAIRRITRTEKCHDPAEILRRLNYTIKRTLQQDKEYALSDDGLDAAICFVQLPVDNSLLTTDSSSLIFAGAKLPLICIHNEEINVIRGDRQSLGYKHSDLNFKFTNHAIHIKKGMSFYMYSDGFTDQFGGKKGLRFGNSRLRNLLKENVRLPFEKQQEILIQVFNEWLEHGEYERLDDVTVAGFRLLSRARFSPHQFKSESCKWIYFALRGLQLLAK